MYRTDGEEGGGTVAAQWEVQHGGALKRGSSSHLFAMQRVVRVLRKTFTQKVQHCRELLMFHVAAVVEMGGGVEVGGGWWSHRL